MKQDRVWSLIPQDRAVIANIRRPVSANFLAGVVLEALWHLSVPAYFSVNPKAAPSAVFGDSGMSKPVRSFGVDKLKKDGAETVRNGADNLKWRRHLVWHWGVAQFEIVC